MFRSTPAAIAAAALIALGGCSTLDSMDTSAFTVDTRSAGADLGYEQINPITVQVAPQVLEFTVAKAFDPTTRRAVTNFGHRFRAVGESALQVAYPASGGEAAERAAARVSHDLIRAGVARESLVIGPYDVEAAGRDGVVLSYDAPTAFSSGCPQNWGDPTRDHRNTYPERMGCAQQANLAAMIDRPRDLEEPRPLTPALQGRRDTVLAAYGAGEATAAEPSSEETAIAE